MTATLDAAARQGAIEIAPQTALIAIALPILYVVGRLIWVARIDLSGRGPGSGEAAAPDPGTAVGGRVVTLTEATVVAPLIAAIATALAILLDGPRLARAGRTRRSASPSPASRSRPRSPSRSAWRPGRRP